MSAARLGNEMRSGETSLLLSGWRSHPAQNVDLEPDASSFCVARHAHTQSKDETRWHPRGTHPPRRQARLQGELRATWKLLQHKLKVLVRQRRGIRAPAFARELLSVELLAVVAMLAVVALPRRRRFSSPFCPGLVFVVHSGYGPVAGSVASR